MLLVVPALLGACTHQVVRGPQPVVAHRSKNVAVNRAMTRQIANAIDAGDGDIEARNLRQRLAADSKDLNARIMLARMYTRRGLPDLALEHYRMAAAQFPEAPIATLELAKTLRQMEAEGEALSVLEQGVSRMPANWELISLQGIILDDQGELAGAEAAHRKALAIDQSRAALHNNLGYNLLLQGKADLAAAELKRAIEIEPQSQIARNNLGAALATGSQSKEALTEWQRSGDPASAHNNLGAVLMEQGKDQEAREEIQTALRFRPAYPPAIANLRLLAAKTGDTIEIPATKPPVSWWSRINFWGKGHKPAAAVVKASR